MTGKEGFAAPRFEPGPDGLTFRLQPVHLDAVSAELTGAGSPLGHGDPPQRLAEFPLVLPNDSNTNYLTFVGKIAADAGVVFCHDTQHDNVLSELNMLPVGKALCLVPDYQQVMFPKHVIVRPLDLDPQPVLDVMVALQQERQVAGTGAIPGGCPSIPT